MSCYACGADTLTVGQPFDLPPLRMRLCPDCAVAERAAEDEQERQAHVRTLLSRAGGGFMQAWTLETYPKDEAGRRPWAQAITWLDLPGRRPNVFLHGQVGTGKTGLAWALIREFCERGTEAAFLNFRDYLYNVRQSFDTKVPVDDRPHHVPILALDDLGAERPTEWAREELATLVDRRRMHRRPTIVTTNYEPAELARRLGHDDPLLGARIVSRLLEAAVRIRFQGRDRRAA